MKVKWIRYNRKKVFIGLFLFLVLVGLTFGYAFVTTKLTIDGIANVKDAKWDIHFTNLQAITGSVTPEEDPTVTNTSVTFSAKVDEPGDFYGFTVDVTNQGTINAEIGNISVTPDFSAIDYIDATVAYDDDTPIAMGDILVAGKSKTIKVLLSYKDGLDDSLYPTTDQEFTVTVSLNYIQHVGYVPSFAADSWSKIKENVMTDKSIYDVGDTKTVKMDMNGDNIKETYKVRVANNTTPSVCSTSGYSQTACGFVVEFQEIVGTHRMNETGTNAGGYIETEMVLYLNDEFYNKLPNDLQSAIIPTYPIVSGSSNNSTSADITAADTTKNKIYLLSTREIGLDAEYDNRKDVTRDTRTLDYYELNNNDDARIKKDLNGTAGIWWKRTVTKHNDTNFASVSTVGRPRGNGAENPYGVSPAFRLAE